MPRQLPNAPRAHPRPPEFSRKRHAPLPRHRGSVPVSRSCPRVAGRLHTCDSPVRRSPPARCRAALPLDLHVLGLSLAFILSQDQTLHCMCLFCYFHCPRQGFLASRKKNMPDARRCLSFLVSSVSKNLALPSSFPPSPKDRSRPESGCKDKPIFHPNPNFSPTFLRKNQTRKHNRLENNGEQECFFSGRTRSSGRRPSDSGNKARPPTRASRKSPPPCWKTGTRNPWPQNLRRTTTRKPLVSTPQPANNRGRGATRPVRTHTRRIPCVFMARSAHVFVPPSRHSRDKAAGLDGCDAAVTRRRGELIPLPHPKRAIATPCTRRVRRQAMPTKEVLPICRYLKLSIGAFPFY